MMNEKVFKKVSVKYSLKPEDVAALKRLIEMHHDGSSPKADVAFDALLESFEEGSLVLQALEEYQRNSVEIPPKWKVLLGILQCTVHEVIKIAKKESDKTIFSVLEMGAKAVCFVVITDTEYGSKLSLRMLFTEVGYTGNVSDIDRKYSKEKRLVPLTSFEKWLMRETIDAEKTRRRAEFRRSCIEFLGEDLATN